MKLLSTLFIIASIIASVYCDGDTNYELTYYGDSSEEHTKKDPSCPQYDDDNLPTYFAALGTSLSHYKSYCDNYAVFMASDGSNVKTLAKAMIVDSCGSCAPYHLDVSLNAFEKINPKKRGEIPIIWGVYSRSGKEVAGPFYDSVGDTAEKLGMSSSAFVSAFSANAKSLASSGSSSKEFSKSGVSVHTTVKKTTTTTTTTRRTTSIVPPPKATSRVIGITRTKIPTPAKQIATKQIPKQLPKQFTTTVIGGFTRVIPITQPVKSIPFGVGINTTTTTATTSVATVATTTATTQAVQPTQSVKPIEKAINEDGKNGDDDSSIGTTVGLLALGGGCIGAAGAGLLFMKKKSPNTYESVKEKFPEAFNKVQRGLSRSATSIKRKVTRRDVGSNPAAYAV